MMTSPLPSMPLIGCTLTGLRKVRGGYKNSFSPGNRLSLQSQFFLGDHSSEENTRHFAEHALLWKRRHTVLVPGVSSMWGCIHVRGCSHGRLNGFSIIAWLVLSDLFFHLSRAPIRSSGCNTHQLISAPFSIGVSILILMSRGEALLE